ncbi:MAG: class I fructose-bisphosphate aldolase [Candidatus Geothermincolia bacterium]
MSTSRVREILGWYAHENPGTRANLSRMLMHGRLAGTGKLVVLPVDQGFEHGPARSFAPNPASYDPRYHVELAIESRCNAYAAPLGFIESAAGEYAGDIPFILKLNNHDVLYEDADPAPALTAGVQDALRLGCAAIGFTVYPGSAASAAMYEQFRELTLQAKAVGLAVVLWCYPRGSALAKEHETAVDVIAYAAHIGCQMGADIIKIKMPTPAIGLEEARKVYEKLQIPISSKADRVRHVVQSAFDGTRIVVFSGGAATDAESLLDDVRAVNEGGGFGSIIGRNSFQRPKNDALRLLSDVMDIYAG